MKTQANVNCSGFKRSVLLIRYQDVQDLFSN